MPTRIVTGLSGLVANNAILLALLAVVMFFAYRRWSRTEAGRKRLDSWKLRLPIFGPLAARSALARFSGSLAVLVSSDVPIGHALSVAGTISGNVVLQAAVEEVVSAVTAGTRISTAMAEEPVFSPLVVQMISVGESTGSLQEMLTRVAELYEQEVSTTVESLTSALEPVLLMVMGVVVGGILLAVYLPMFGAIDLIR